MHFEDISRDIRAAEAALRKLGDTIDAAIAARQSRPPAAPAAAAPPPRAHADSPSGRHDSPVAAFGRNKGLPLTELDDKDLEWLAGALQTSIDDPSKRAYIRKNSADLENVRREQADRRV